MIKKIAETPFQEIGSHTYSHYYCREDGQTKEEFSADLKSAKEVLKPYNDTVCSLIFPRNQVNLDYLDVLKDHEIKNYRGCEKSWIYAKTPKAFIWKLIQRFLRLADCYIDISGNNCYSVEDIRTSYGLNNIASSRFFRPYTRKLALMEPLRLHRIKSQMRYAAKKNQVFHLWWHPHNFGKNQKENLKNLCRILNYYKKMQNRYGMISLNMREIGDMIK